MNKVCIIIPCILYHNYITCKLQHKRTSVLLAAWNGHSDVVNFLVERGADVNTKDKVSLQNTIHT